MTSLNLQEALREPSANAAPATYPESSRETAPEMTPPAIEPASGKASKDHGGGYLIGADDAFWVYRPRASGGASVREEGRKAAARSAASTAAPPVALRDQQTGLSLREAAALAGASKSSILRAIQSGRLAAPKTEDGSYAIDPAALLAVFPAKSDRAAPAAPGKADSRAAKSVLTRNAPDELAARMAALEVEIKNLKGLLGEVNPPRTWWRRLAG